MNVIEELRRIERDILPAPWTTARGLLNSLVLSVGRLCIASLGWNTREEDAKHARAIVAMRNSHAALLRVAEAAHQLEEADFFYDALRDALNDPQAHVDASRAHATVERMKVARIELRAALAELEALEL